MGSARMDRCRRRFRPPRRQDQGARALRVSRTGQGSLTSEIRTMPATPDQVRKVMQQYIQAWATGDRELFLSLFALDARWADPVGSPEFVGHQAIGGFWDFARKGNRSLTPKLEEMRACANEGVLRFTMQVRVPERNEGLDLSI